MNDHAADDHRTDRVQSVLERGHDAKIPSAAPERPEQVAVLIDAGSNQPPVGEHDVCAEQIVDRHAERPPEPTEATTERESGDSRVANGPSRCRESMRLRRRVELRPLHSGLRSRCALCGVDCNGFHRREIDDEAFVAGARASNAVSTTANRQW